MAEELRPSSIRRLPRRRSRQRQRSCACSRRRGDDHPGRAHPRVRLPGRSTVAQCGLRGHKNGSPHGGRWLSTPRPTRRARSAVPAAVRGAGSASSADRIGVDSAVTHFGFAQRSNSGRKARPTPLLEWQLPGIRGALRLRSGPLPEQGCHLRPPVQRERGDAADDRRRPDRTLQNVQAAGPPPATTAHSRYVLRWPRALPDQPLRPLPMPLRTSIATPPSALGAVAPLASSPLRARPQPNPHSARCTTVPRAAWPASETQPDRRHAQSALILLSWPLESGAGLSFRLATGLLRFPPNWKKWPGSKAEQCGKSVHLESLTAFRV